MIELEITKYPVELKSLKKSIRIDFHAIVISHLKKSADYFLLKNT